MFCSNSGLKAQIEIHLYIYFKHVFSFYKFLQVHTTKKTKETKLNFKQLNKKTHYTVKYLFPLLTVYL